MKREANENRSDEQEIDEGGEEVGSGGGTVSIGFLKDWTGW